MKCSSLRNIGIVYSTNRAVAALAIVLVICLGGRAALAEEDPGPCYPVPAGTGASCMDDVTTCNLLNGCTANDVYLAIYNVFGTCTQDGMLCVVGNSPDCDSGGGTCVPDVISCTKDELVTLTLQAEMVAQAAERWDIGLYIALDGGDALTGDCFRDFLNVTPLEPGTTGVCSGDSSILCTDDAGCGADGPCLIDCTTVCSTSTTTSCFKDDDCPTGETCDFGYDPNSGAGPYYDGECTEDPPDLCGDLEQGVHTYLNLPEITIVCQDEDGNGFLDLGTCTSWDNGTSDGSANKPSCMNEVDTIPNTTAKCKCEPIQVGTVEVFLCGDNDVNRTEETCDGTDLGSTVCTSCRDPKTTDECTCCGDGFVQPDSGEECEPPNTEVCDSNCRQTGACCHGTTGICEDNVLPGDCMADQDDWYKATPCSAVTCLQHTGACCDRATGICTKDVLPQNCQGGKRDWHKGMPCSAVDCYPEKVPTLSTWGAIIMTLLLLAGVIYSGRRAAALDD